MPRFLVREIRARNSAYLIDAEDEKAAVAGNGDFVTEDADADDYGQEVVSVEQVDDDTEEIG